MKLFGKFTERGYSIEAFLPTDSNEPGAWTIRIKRGRRLIRKASVPMLREPRYGPDAEDVAQLEKETDRLLKKLP